MSVDACYFCGQTGEPLYEDDDGWYCEGCWDNLPDTPDAGKLKAALDEIHEIVQEAERKMNERTGSLQDPA